LTEDYGEIAARQIKTVSASNGTRNPSQSLQSFDLLQLQQYTKEKAYSPTASKDFHLFFVGRDDVHDILKFVGYDADGWLGSWVFTPPRRKPFIPGLSRRMRGGDRSRHPTGPKSVPGIAELPRAF
jgi:hypothetical protein